MGVVNLSVLIVALHNNLSFFSSLILILLCIYHRMCVKSLVDKSPFEAITDKCPHLKNLCVVLEHIFMHRIQGLT